MSSQNNTSAIELAPHNLISANEDVNISTAPADGDAIIQASRAADGTVPDGGYGWVVLFGCGVITWWFGGTSYSWGVIQGALVQQGLGEVLSGWSTRNVGGLFMTTGVIVGMGTAISFMVVSVTPAQYFSKKRGLANGIVYASGGLGGTVISFAMNGLIQKLGVAWTFRVIGFMTLATGLPAVCLIRERAPIRSATFIEWRLFRDVRFAVLFLAGAVATFPLLVPPFFLPLYSNSLGLSASTGAGLVAGFNFSSVVGRIGCGFMSDHLGPLNTLLISILLSATSMLALWPVSESLGPLAAFVVINGAANGGFFATMPTVVGNVFGSQRVAVAMGMIVTSWAGGYLLGAPISGYMLNAYGGEHGGFQAYRPAIFYAGSMALGSAGMVALVKLRVSANILKKV